jgi:hypothetical protein
MLEYRDVYGNIFGDFEHAINPKYIELILETGQPNFNYRLENVDKNGVQVGHFMENNMTSDEKKDLNILFKWSYQDLATYHVVVIGLPVEKRQELFQKELTKHNKNRSILYLIQIEIS